MISEEHDCFKLLNRHHDPRYTFVMCSCDKVYKYEDGEYRLYLWIEDGKINVDY